jgi:xylan 1,4-beta-xylosidase
VGIVARYDGQAVIRNPVVPGSHPDPSICRVGADYYLATSTFEWFPGITLHHSTDLAHWRLAGHALTRTTQLDLRGVDDSAGVWAPSLSHHAGRFWLVYGVMRTPGRPFHDVDNYLVTAERIEGPWSEPVYLNSSGFDPSLHHAEDGTTWLLNLRWDHRPDAYAFAGIDLQRYDPDARALTGRPVTVLANDDRVLREGPNLYRHGGWYHLMLAEGGTGWEHGIRMARSRTLAGPYRLDPEPLLTTRHSPDHPLQKAGHGELMRTPEGEWYLVHLASRPVDTAGGPRCVLGRETCVQRVVWTDGPEPRLRLAQGGVLPAVELPAPAGAPATPAAPPVHRDDFTGPALGPRWRTLREPPAPDWLSVTERPGFLRLRGRHSPHSRFAHSLVAQPLRSLRCEATTVLEFTPRHPGQLAGLMAWYDASTYYYLRVTYDERLGGPVLGLAENDDGRYREHPGHDLPVADWPRCHLRARFDHAALRFAASPDGTAWRDVGPVLDASRLSDDYGSRLRFTGAHVGLAAHDLHGTRAAADFGFFEIRDR